MDILLPGSVAVAVSAALAPPHEPIDTIAATISPSASVAPAAVREPATPPAYVIVDIPAFNLRHGSARTDRISVEDHNRARGVPTQQHRAASMPTDHIPVGLTAVSSPAGLVHTNLNDAVVAVHDDRIMLIRRRIDRAQSDDANGEATLRDLATRLARAEAARDLAVGRADRLGACCGTGLASRTPAPTHDQPPRPDPTPPAPLAPATAARSYSNSRSPTDLAAAVRGRRVGPPPVASSAVATSRLSPSPTPIRVAVDESSADALERARTHLATARQLLENDHFSAQTSFSSATEHSPAPLWPSPSSELAIILTTLLLMGALARGRPLPIPARLSAAV